jgi:hypothetical protein
MIRWADAGTAARGALKHGACSIRKCIGTLPWDTRFGAWSSQHTSRSFAAPQLAGLRSALRSVTGKRERGDARDRDDGSSVVEPRPYPVWLSWISSERPGIGLVVDRLETSGREVKGARCAEPVENGCGADCSLSRPTSQVGDYSFASLRNPPEPRAQVGQHTSEALRSSGKVLSNRQRTER